MLNGSEDFGGRMYGKPEYDPIMEAYMCEICYEKGDNHFSENLSFHVWRKHSITIAEYKEMYGLDRSVTLVSDIFRAKRKAILKEIGTAANIKKGVNFQKGNQVGKYERSFQTKIRLRSLRKKSKG